MSESLFNTDVALTFSDVTRVPNNPMYARLQPFLSQDEKAELQRLRDIHINTNRDVEERVSRGEGGLELQRVQCANGQAYRDYKKYELAMAAKYPKAEPVKSRDLVSLVPNDPNPLGSIPIISANQIGLGPRLIKAVARYGMTGIVFQGIRQGKSTSNEHRKMQLKNIRDDMRTSHPWHREVAVLTPDAEVTDWYRWVQQYEDDVAIIVEGTRNKFDRDAEWLGLVGRNEIKKAKGRSFEKMSELMKSAEDVITAPPTITRREAIDIMDRNTSDEVHRHLLPIVEGNKVLGITSHASAGYGLRFPPHIDKDHDNQLAYLVAMRLGEDIEFIRECIAEKLVGRGIRLDHPNAYHGTDPEVIVRQVRDLIDELDPTLDLHVGNVASVDAALAFAEAGAKKIVVGVGPGGGCTTRIMTGTGVPQVSIVNEIRTALNNHGYHHVLVVSDGGVRKPGDLAKNDAEYFYMGTPFMKTREAMPAINNFHLDRGKWTTWTGGSASPSAQLGVSKKKDEKNPEVYRRTQGTREEGDSNEETPMDQNYSTVRELGKYFTDGRTSSVTFAGADNMEEDGRYAVYREQSQSGAEEGKPLNIR